MLQHAVAQLIKSGSVFSGSHFSVKHVFLVESQFFLSQVPDLQRKRKCDQDEKNGNSKLGSDQRFFQVEFFVAFAEHLTFKQGYDFVG